MRTTFLTERRRPRLHSCHSRESGNPETMPDKMDSRFRGSDPDKMDSRFRGSDPDKMDSRFRGSDPDKMDSRFRGSDRTNFRGSDRICERRLAARFRGSDRISERRLTARLIAFAALVFFTVAPTPSFAAERFPQPEFETNYTMPDTDAPPSSRLPASGYIDLATLTVALGLSAYFSLKYRQIGRAHV